ncbi:hypothetical protein [Rhodoferax sp.]
MLQQTNGLNNVGLEILSPAFDAMSADAIGEVTRETLDKYLPDTAAR